MGCFLFDIWFLIEIFSRNIFKLLIIIAIIIILCWTPQI